jgi:uncharacterized surface protein with fasciclin (FAS1) repeats
MKTFLCLLTIFSFLILGCSQEDKKVKTSDKSGSDKVQTTGGQSNVKDDVSQKDVVKIAVGSPDHTTLVTALKAAELVDVLSNAGPFTVFAPTNSAFDKLPKGTLEDLLKPENKNKLADILQHHVAVAVYSTDMLQDGQVLNMVDGTNAMITKKDGATFIDKGKIAASVKATNGIVHIIDEVVLPPSK